MKNDNLQIFSAILDWLSNNQDCWLCTVTETWGSSPRPRGSLMAFNSLDEQVGSLSGGCIEEDLIEKIKNNEIVKSAQFIIFGGSLQESERLQLPCGGTVGVLIEHFNQAHLDHVSSIVKELSNHQPITRKIEFKKKYLLSTEILAFQFQQVNQEPILLTHTISGVQQIFIIGASVVAIAVAELALWLNYEVIICDPRKEKLEDWTIQGCKLVNLFPDDALNRYSDNPNLIILALTHDPRIDDMGLLKAFETNARYIGAMGSKKTSQKRRERLFSLGVSEENIAKLHAPIGLDISSKTPMEIALSIMAELTLLKNQN